MTFIRIILTLTISSLLACDGTQSSDSTISGEISLQPISFNQWTAKLPEYQPNIVVVDMWATWCSPCIERFPKMVDMNARYSEQGVSFIALNLDDSQDTQALTKAEKFLRDQNAVFDNYFMNENIIDAFEKLDLLGIPAVVIYDGAGTERYRLTGDNPNAQFTDADIEKAIQALLAEQQAA